MAELSTLARPYAKAAFETARAGDNLVGWSSQLARAATAADDEQMASLLTNPSLTAEQKATALIDVCEKIFEKVPYEGGRHIVRVGDALDDKGRNFIRVLADNQRLPLLGEIAAQFERYRANQEKSVEVTVLTAFPLAEEAGNNLAKVLSRKLEREVRVESQVDENLLGGVLIRADDMVIDGSVRGRLNKLAETMKG